MSCFDKFDVRLALILLAFIQSLLFNASGARIRRTGVERLGNIAREDREHQDVHYQGDSAGEDGRPISECASLPDKWGQYISQREHKGQGGTGFVAQSMLSCPAQEPIRAALKVVKLTNASGKSVRKKVENEVQALRDVRQVFLNHPEKAEMRPYVMSLLGSQEKDDHSFIASPWYNNGELEVLMQGQNADRYGGMSAMYGFLLHIAKGVRLMHEAGWVHGDLKGGNAMVSCVDGSTVAGNCHATLIDFDTACKIGEKACGFKGTPYYMAPEVLLRKSLEEPDPKTDVWSLGIMLWEARFGFALLPTRGDFEGFHEKVRGPGGIYYKIQHLKELSFEGACELPAEENTLKELLKGMLTQDLESRLTMDQVIQELSKLADEKMVTSPASVVSENSGECLDPDYEAFQCCYTPVVLWSGKKDTHHMTKGGESCREDNMKSYVDRAACINKAGGSCEACWESCCKQVRHVRVKTSKCAGNGAEEKKKKECRAVH